MTPEEKARVKIDKQLNSRRVIICFLWMIKPLLLLRLSVKKTRWVRMYSSKQRTMPAILRVGTEYGTRAGSH